MKKTFIAAFAVDVPQENGKLVPNTFTHWNQINPKFPKTKIEVLGPPPSSGTRDPNAEDYLDYDVVTTGKIRVSQSLNWG